MIKKTLTILLIEDSPEYAELVQQWLSMPGDISFVLNWTDSLMAGLNRLSQGGVDVILLDLGLPDSDGLSTFTTASIHAAGVPIIVLSGGDDEALALDMVQEGAQDYLLKSTCNRDVLARAIQYTVLRYGGSARSADQTSSLDHTRVIGIMGVKGGVGTTTIACNLAMEFRRQTGQKTLLADLDLDAGLVDFLTNTGSQYSVLDAIGSLRHLDISCWEAIVAQAPDGLHVLRSPGLLGASEPDADRLRELLNVIRTFYRWIVLDLGRLNSLSTMLLDRVNELFLVTTTGVPALYQAKRVICALKASGLGANRLRLVVNQQEKIQDYSGTDLDDMFGIPAYATLPVADRGLHEACIRRKALAETSEFRRAVATLARKVAGMPEKKPTSIVSQWFSHAETLHNTTAGSPGTAGV